MGKNIKSLTIQGHNCRLIPEWSDSYAHGITHQDLLDGEYETEFGIVHTTTVNTHFDPWNDPNHEKGHISS